MNKTIIAMMMMSLFFALFSAQTHQVAAVSLMKVKPKIENEVNEEVVLNETLSEPETKQEVALLLNLPVKNMNDVKKVTKDQFTVSNYSVEEIEMLAKLVNGEARGESFEGKVAVAAVTVNRTLSARFPNSIKEVIFESGAYTAVSDGQYDQKPGAESYKAVYAALSGRDPSSGALFYYNPDIATDDWIRTRHIIKEIGKHVFTR
ncbi:cell wall hydrolase [Pseudalkalibacillus sp. NRS-1564]|uniref:cell wall hydrolase n=1 Tax=Pseudalkalibacillus sp. NRS-1564 TaxID=3233900 RepID=UPI003D26D988